MSTETKETPRVYDHNHPNACRGCFLVLESKGQKHECDADEAI